MRNQKPTKEQLAFVRKMRKQSSGYLRVFWTRKLLKMLVEAGEKGGQS